MGQHLAVLESPDDLVGFFDSLAEGVIVAAGAAPGRGEEQHGADANSAMGLYLRMACARYTAMSFEAGAAGKGDGAWGRGARGRRGGGGSCSGVVQ